MGVEHDTLAANEVDSADNQLHRGGHVLGGRLIVGPLGRRALSWHPPEEGDRRKVAPCLMNFIELHRQIGQAGVIWHTIDPKANRGFATLIGNMRSGAGTANLAAQHATGLQDSASL
jgi:hypothetical protein